MEELNHIVIGLFGWRKVKLRVWDIGLEMSRDPLNTHPNRGDVGIMIGAFKRIAAATRLTPKAAIIATAGAPGRLKSTAPDG